MYHALKKSWVSFRDRDKPDPKDWHLQCRLTPDIWKLEQYHRQLIFVCDDMMKGNKNHSLIAEASASGDDPFHPTCYTLKPFTLWKKDLGTESFPVAMEDGYEPTGFLRWPAEPARIRGELYAIRPYQFIKLDIHRQNGVQFRRIRTAITLPYNQVKYTQKRPLPKIAGEYIETIQAWMYVGVPEYWDNLLGGVFNTKPVDLFEHDKPRTWIDKYYKFKQDI